MFFHNGITHFYKMFLYVTYFHYTYLKPHNDFNWKRKLFYYSQCLVLSEKQLILRFFFMISQKNKDLLIKRMSVDEFGPFQLTTELTKDLSSL